MSHTTVSPQFLLWAQLIFVWAVSSYAITSDPFGDEKGQKATRRWWIILALRSVAATALAAMMSHSVVLSFAMLVSVGAFPLVRMSSSTKLLAELECCFASSSVAFVFWYVQHFQLILQSRLVSLPMSAERLAALCSVGATLLFTVRGGTYTIRGILKKADVLPQKEGELDTDEVSRGRLIGNIERLILTIVVAAGSYAALGFLVAAKGLIRAEDLKGRDFTEYFLVGSLASVLVALCTGLVIRFVLVALWPELLSLQMQSS